MSKEIASWESVRNHQIPHTAVTVRHIHSFHIEEKQLFPREGLQEYQDLKEKSMQYLTCLGSLGEPNPLEEGYRKADVYGNKDW